MTLLNYREMIFEHPFSDNFFSHTQITFYFISPLFWFPCKYLLFLCKLWLSYKLSTKLVVQITPLLIIIIVERFMKTAMLSQSKLK